MSRHGSHRTRCVVAAGLVLLTAGLRPAGAATMSLPDGVGSAPGGSTLVTLSIDDATGILGTDIVIEYDPSVITATAVAKTALSQNQTLQFNLTMPGSVSIALYGPLALSGGGPLLQIEFDSTGPSGSQTALYLTFGEANEGAIPLSLEDGSLCVGGTAPEVTGLTLAPAGTFPVSRIAWSPHPSAATYAVYRSSSPAAASFSCFASGIVLTELEDDGAVPGPGFALYHLVVADTCAGPSSAGLDSDGMERLLSVSCP